MNMVLKHNKKDNKERNESIHGLLWSLPRVPPHLDVFSGNTKIGGLFGRYRFNKQSKGGRYAQYKKNKTFNLKIGGSKYNPLLEIWGISYLKQSPFKDLRRNKPIFKEIPSNIQMVRRKGK